jgi:hypothetical protein
VEKCKHGLSSLYCAFCQKVVRETTGTTKGKRVVKATPLKLQKKTDKATNFVESMQMEIPPGESLCVGCMKPHKVAFMRQGSVYVGLRFMEKETEVVLEFDGKDFVEIERVSKKIPIGERRRGLICEACASNHSTREVKHRDGSITYEPVVKISQTATEHTTLNPGWSREDALSSPEDKVDHLGFVVEDEVDRPSYSKMQRVGRTKAGEFYHTKMHQRLGLR